MNENKEKPEQVLCYPRYLVDRFLPDAWNETYPVQLFQDGCPSWVDKQQAEKNPHYKQVCCYCLVRHGDRFLVYTRPSGIGEQKLKGKLSVGVGGHISDGPDWPHRAIENGVSRELREELGIQKSAQFQPVLLGCINSNADPVSAIHLGLVYSLEFVELPSVLRMSPELHEPAFLPQEDLLATGWQSAFEHWSRIVIENVID